jgi:Flp pilus assembly protein TadD
MQDLVLRQPGNPTFYIFLGIAAYAQEEEGDAETIFRKALELNPDIAEAYYCLGILLAGQWRDGEAEAAYPQGHRPQTRLRPCV